LRNKIRNAKLLFYSQIKRKISNWRTQERILQFSSNSSHRCGELNLLWYCTICRSHIEKRWKNKLKNYRKALLPMIRKPQSITITIFNFLLCTCINFFFPLVSNILHVIFFFSFQSFNLVLWNLLIQSRYVLLHVTSDYWIGDISRRNHLSNSTFLRIHSCVLQFEIFFSLQFGSKRTT